MYFIVCLISKKNTNKNDKIHAQKQHKNNTHKKGFFFSLDDGVENVADISLSVGVLATFLTPNVFFFIFKIKKYRIKRLL